MKQQKLIGYVEQYVTLFEQEENLKSNLKLTKNLLSSNKIPLWVLMCYSTIHRSVGTKAFTFEEAQMILNRDQVAQYLKELRKYKMLDWSKGKEDLRITYYQLRDNFGGK